MATREIPSVPGQQITPVRIALRSKFRSIHYWAAIGTIFLIIQIYVFGSWILSGEVHPQPTGADPVPTGVKVAAWTAQAASILGALAVVVYVWRRTRREGQLAWDALVAIAFAGVYWQDTAINYARPVFFYNSYLINLGAWNPHLPGWLSPFAGNLPEPILMILPLNAWWYVLFGIAFCAMARRLRRVWPNIGNVGIFLAGVVSLAIFDVALEAVFIRTQLFAYGAVINGFAVFPGTTYQFPIWEALLVGVFCSIVGMIRLNRDDRGRSVIEQGVDDLEVGARTNTTLRVLAFLGLSNVMYALLGVIYVWLSFYVDDMPHFPSYLNNNLCGPAISAPCPGPEVPVLINNTPHRS